MVKKKKLENNLKNNLGHFEKMFTKKAKNFEIILT